MHSRKNTEAGQQPVRRSRLLRRLGLAMAAALLALAAAEIAVRQLAPQRLSGSWLVVSGRGYNLNRPSADAPHAASGRQVRYQINELGFRGGPPRNARRRVLVVGDSFTFGWLLDQPDTYVAQLDARSLASWGPDGVELMNAAVGGWGTADYVAFVEDRGDAFKPDAILVFLNNLDVSRTMRSGLWARADGASGIARRNVVQPFALVKRINSWSGYHYLIERSHAAQLGRQALIRVIANRRPESAAPLPNSAGSRVGGQPDLRTIEGVTMTQELFRRLQAWCDARQVPLWVVTTGFTDLHGPSTTGAADHEDAVFLQQAPRFFSELGVPFLDLAPALDGGDHRTQAWLKIAGDGHPTEEASRRIADASWPWLQTKLAPLVASDQAR